MDKERMEMLIIDLIDGKLSGEDKQLIEHELQVNAEARRLYDELTIVISAMDDAEDLEPSSNLRLAFEEELRKESSAGGVAKTIFLSPQYYRAAAVVALLILGVGIGYWVNIGSADRARLAELETKLEATRQEVAEAKSAMFTMLGNDQSASQRLKGVAVAMELPNTDDETINVLFKTMRGDRNTNVRLAALDALARFQHEPQVRKRLIESLVNQSDPMVQIKLIQLLVELKEKGVVDQLQDIVDDESITKAVKDEAYSGILKLS